MEPMLNASLLRRQAERCYRVARACFDLSAATEMNAIGDELLANARELEGRQGRRSVFVTPADSDRAA
jgi:hypothetical protein